MRVVLVATRNPLNIGAAARAMSNFGFERLRVVRPFDEAFREARSAVGAPNLLKNAEIAMYQAIPLQNLLLETDAPFLTPTPYRGTICEPKHVRVTAEFLRNLRSESLDQLASATTENAIHLFGLS